MDQFRIWCTIRQLLRSLTCGYKQQQIGRVRYFQVIGLVFAAEDRMLVFVTSDSETDDEKGTTDSRQSVNIVGLQSNLGRVTFITLFRTS